VASFNNGPLYKKCETRRCPTGDIYAAGLAPNGIFNAGVVVCGEDMNAQNPRFGTAFAAFRREPLGVIIRLLMSSFPNNCLTTKKLQKNTFDFLLNFYIIILLLDEQLSNTICLVFNAQLLKQGFIRVHRQQHIRNDKLFRRSKKA
jgi:hypothetical protein